MGILDKFKGIFNGLLTRLDADPKLFGLVFLVPTLGLVIVLNIFPIIYSLNLSLHDYALRDVGLGFWPKVFVGLKNYFAIFKDPAWIITVENTLFWTIIALTVTLPICLGIALVFNEEFIGVRLVRVIPTVMWAVPSVTAVIIMGWLFSGGIGLVNNVLRLLGIIKQPVVWLLGKWSARSVVAISQFFFTCPFIILMLLAALQSAPKHLYEAALLDGASVLGRFRHVTIPSIKNTLFTSMALLTMWNINLFAFPFVITGGGPFYMTTSMNYLVFQEGFKYWNLGYASALSWILLFVTIFGAYLNIRQLEM